MTGPAPALVYGDARSIPLPDESVDLVVTSPPYFGLRSYTDGGQHYVTQIGAEATPREFIAALVECTREMVRVVKPSGSIFVNLGDKYSTYESRPGNAATHDWAQKSQAAERYRRSAPAAYGVPYKSLMLLPWRYALACADDLGLIVRQELIWSKRSAMPTRITDRARRTHEVFLHFTRQQSYFANLDAVRQDGAVPSSVREIGIGRLAVPTAISVEHSAVFPVEWPEFLIRGWCPSDGVVLDPFGGTGTTALVAAMHDRVGISLDASRDYGRIAAWRCSDPKERARAAGLDPDAVATMRPEVAGQGDLFAGTAS